MICENCKKEKNDVLNREFGILCKYCNEKLSNYVRPQKECAECGEEKAICAYINNKPLCHKCYLKTYQQPERECSNCKEIKKITDSGRELCHKCYMLSYEPKLEICCICNNKDEVHTRDENGKSICNSCYYKIYEQPLKVCSGCGNLRKIVYKNPDLCQSCRVKQRMKEDINFAIRTKLRKRISKLIRNNKMNKNVKKLINCDEIVLYLGKCPGNLLDYHIDHIFPLSAFDLNNPIHIEAAFSPENHQWLLKSENLKKSDNYDYNNFLNFLKKFEN